MKTSRENIVHFYSQETTTTTTKKRKERKKRSINYPKKKEKNMFDESIRTSPMISFLNFQPR